MSIDIIAPKDDEQFSLNESISVKGTADSSITSVTLYSPLGGTNFPLVSKPIPVISGQWSTVIIFNTGGERAVVVEGLDSDGNSFDFEPLEITLKVNTNFRSPVGSGFVVTSDFRSPRRRSHKGIDLAHSGGARSTTGKPVFAVADGKVSASVSGCDQTGDIRCGGGYGNFIYLEHGNDIQTRYAHLLKNEVRLGDDVRQGEVIGSVGNSGRSTGPHLHFEVRKKSTGIPFDPKDFISNF